MDNSQTINEEVTAVEEFPSESLSNPSKRRNNKPMAQTNTSTEQLTTEKEGKSKRDRKIGLLPSPTSEQTKVNYEGTIVAETTWSALPPRKMFSVNANGTNLCFKISKSSYCNILTEEISTNVPPQSQLKVYRIRLA